MEHLRRFFRPYICMYKNSITFQHPNVQDPYATHSVFLRLILQYNQYAKLHPALLHS